MKWVRTPRQYLHEVLLLGLLASSSGLRRQRRALLGLLPLPALLLGLLLLELRGFTGTFLVRAALLRFGSSTSSQLLPHGVRQRLAEPSFIISPEHVFGLVVRLRTGRVAGHISWGCCS